MNYMCRRFFRKQPHSLYHIHWNNFHHTFRLNILKEKNKKKSHKQYFIKIKLFQLLNLLEQKTSMAFILFYFLLNVFFTKHLLQSNIYATSDLTY